MHVFANLITSVYMIIHFVCGYLAGCEGLTPPGYGRIVSTTGNNIDDTTTFECDEGFTLIGSATRRCLSNGQWSGVPTQCAGKLLR